MKKTILLLIILIILILTFTSCTGLGNRKSFFEEDDNKIADDTFEKLIGAIKSKDDVKIVDMFSNEIKGNKELSDSAVKLIDFIQGDIISFSTASEAGVGAQSVIENGKKKKEIESSFCIKTTQNTYYLAIKECTKDEIKNNIGILSIYIIELKNWPFDYVYRGDQLWTKGINIVNTFQEEEDELENSINFSSPEEIVRFHASQSQSG